MEPVPKTKVTNSQNAFESEDDTEFSHPSLKPIYRVDALPGGGGGGGGFIKIFLKTLVISIQQQGILNVFM